MAVFAAARALSARSRERAVMVARLSTQPVVVVVMPGIDEVEVIVVVVVIVLGREEL